MARNIPEVPATVRCCLIIKKGVPLTQVRSNIGEPQIFNWTWAEGFNHLHISTQTRVINDNIIWEPDDIYLKPQANARQTAYIRMSEENAAPALQQLWRQCGDQGRAAFQLNLFVYVRLQNANRRQNPQNNVQRATQARINAARAAILAHNRANNLENAGPLELEHQAQVIARLPPNPENEQMQLPPQTQLGLQLRQLDQISQRNIQEDAEHNTWRLLQVRMNGVILPIEISVESLRLALNLPFMEANQDELRNLNQPQDNMEDIDHNPEGGI